MDGKHHGFDLKHKAVGSCECLQVPRGTGLAVPRHTLCRLSWEAGKAVADMSGGSSMCVCCTLCTEGLHTHAPRSVCRCVCKHAGVCAWARVAWVTGGHPTRTWASLGGLSNLLTPPSPLCRGCQADSSEGGL